MGAITSYPSSTEMPLPSMPPTSMVPTSSSSKRMGPASPLAPPNDNSDNGPQRKKLRQTQPSKQPPHKGKIISTASLPALLKTPTRTSHRACNSSRGSTATSRGSRANTLGSRGAQALRHHQEVCTGPGEIMMLSMYYLMPRHSWVIAQQQDANNVWRKFWVLGVSLVMKCHIYTFYIFGLSTLLSCFNINLPCTCCTFGLHYVMWLVCDLQ